MKQGQQSKRPRGHRGNGRRPSGGGRNSNFESSGPQGKIRGTAYQVIEKYQALGRDALTFGDRVAAENYFQHAEHYYRVMVANGAAEQRSGRNVAQPQNRPQQSQGQEQGQAQEQQPQAQSSMPSDGGSADEGERAESHDSAATASQYSTELPDQPPTETPTEAPTEPQAESSVPPSEGIAAEDSAPDRTELDGSTA